MPISLTLLDGNDSSANVRFEDEDLRAAIGSSDGRPGVLALSQYIADRLRDDLGIAPLGANDRDTVRRVATHWIEGLAGTTGTIQIVPVDGVGDGHPGEPGAGTWSGPASVTLRQAVVARRQPLDLVYDDHLQARSHIVDLINEVGDPVWIWTRAGGWEPVLPHSDDDQIAMTERTPVVAIGEALQALEQSLLPERAVFILQDLVWDLYDDQQQVLATAIPTLWEQLRRIDGLFILLMPTDHLPESWQALFRVMRFRTGTSTPVLDRFGTDLTALARDGRLHPIAGREIERKAIVLALLTAPGAANNPLLLGPFGAGKTALCEQVAIDLAHSSDPRLRCKRLILVDMAALVADTENRGALESRVTQLIVEAVENSEEIVLVIDEIHTVVSTAGAPAVEALKAPLASSQVRIIGATTPEDWAPVERLQPAFASRFRPIHINSPTLEQTVAAMATHVPRLEAHHPGLRIPGEDLRFIAEAAADFEPSAPAPRRPISILYDCAARADVAGSGRISRETVVASISDAVGAPIGPVTGKELEMFQQLTGCLGERILGQDRAVAVLSEGATAHRLSWKRVKPSCFLFVGPSGVGKSQAAKELSWLLVPGQQLISVAMQTLNEAHTAARLFGSPPGYVGYDEGGQLPNQARRTPYRVVLLDEFEKAHPEVIKQLMTVLDTGLHVDHRGLAADFRRWVFVLTTNLIRDETTLRLPPAQLIQACVEAFAAYGVPPEVVGRLGVVVPFFPLDDQVLRLIVTRRLTEFRTDVAEIAASNRFFIDWRPEVPECLVSAVRGSDLGARIIDQILAPIRNAWAPYGLQASGEPVTLMIEVTPDGRNLHLRQKDWA